MLAFLYDMLSSTIGVSVAGVKAGSIAAGVQASVRESALYAVVHSPNSEARERQDTSQDGLCLPNIFQRAWSLLTVLYPPDQEPILD